MHDPACGTAGFLLAAWAHMKQHPDARKREVYSKLKNRFSGVDIVAEVVRLAAMNLYLHGITGVDSIVEAKDALLGAGGRSYDVVLTNPPFGRKQSYRIVRDDGEIDSEREDYDRSDFFVTTSNKQLNFLQHIMTVLAPEGRAGVVLPDNVLFEGGAGETIRRRLLHNFDFHTLLRLPTGIFYKQGVKANVLFFDKKPPSEQAATRDLWIYDLRTNQRFTLKERPMTRADLDDFVGCFRSGRRSERGESERFRRFSVSDLLARDKLNLDVFWLKDDTLDDPDLLPRPMRWPPRSSKAWKRRWNGSAASRQHSRPSRQLRHRLVRDLPQELAPHRLGERRVVGAGQGERARAADHLAGIAVEQVRLLAQHA